MRFKKIYKMKKISILFVLLITAVGYWSCEKENLDEIGNWELIPAEIKSPNALESVVLNELTPNETVTFSWNPATTTSRFAITYSVVLDTLDSAKFDTPVLELPSGGNGRETSLSISHSTINEFLSYSGYSVSDLSKLTWAVKAKCLDRFVYTSANISFKRFPVELIPAKLFISGTATENNNILANAIEMQRLNNSTGQLSNNHEIYTSLVAGKTYKFFSEKTLPCQQYGGASGVLVKSGGAIAVATSGQYKISVNLENNTYSLLKINNWSVVGGVISGGWGGDIPLTYQGGSIWKSSVQLVSTGGFVFRANGDWGIVLKSVANQPSRLVQESQAASQGVNVRDINNTVIGNYFVILKLTASGYNYSVEVDNTVVVPIAAPSQLFLLANGAVITELVKNGNVFSSPKFIPFQSSVNYTLNSMANGLGLNYSVSGQVGMSSAPDGDKVSGSNNLNTTAVPLTVTKDRGLRLSIDFSNRKLNWEYYNFKLFHWQVWDTRNEFSMTYQHPNKYSITTNLMANFQMKFISPWDFDIGSTTPSALTGNLVATGGSNINSVTTAGSYKVTISLNDTYQGGTYVYTLQ